VEDAEENQTGLSNDHVQLVQKIEAEWKEKLEKSKIQFKSELEFLESSFNRQVKILSLYVDLLIFAFDRFVSGNI